MPPPCDQSSFRFGEAVHDAGHQQRADAERGVVGVERDLGEREFLVRGAAPTLTGWIRTGRASASALRQNGSSELAEVHVLDVGGDDDADRAIVHRALKLGGGGFGVDERHRGDPREALGIVRGPFRQRVVEHAVPGDTVLAGQAIAEDVGPGADDLMVDVLFVHPFVALGDGLDKAREERPDLEAVVEAQRLLAAVGGGEADAMAVPRAFDRGDELRRDVVGVDVDGHPELL